MNFLYDCPCSVNDSYLKTFQLCDLYHTMQHSSYCLPKVVQDIQVYAPRFD